MDELVLCVRLSSLSKLWNTPTALSCAVRFLKLHFNTDNASKQTSEQLMFALPISLLKVMQNALCFYPPTHSSASRMMHVPAWQQRRVEDSLDTFTSSFFHSPLLERRSEKRISIPFSASHKQPPMVTMERYSGVIAGTQKLFS